MAAIGGGREIPILAEREEDDEKRDEIGKHQPLHLFLNVLVIGRQYGLCVKKEPITTSIEKAPAIWPHFMREKSPHFSVAAKCSQILSLLCFLSALRLCRLHTVFSKAGGTGSLKHRPQ